MPENFIKMQRNLRYACFFLLVFLGSAVHPAFASSLRSLSIQECYRLARENYPLIRQLDLIEKTKQYSLENASKGNWPQLSVSGQATYQSEVTQFPFSLPGADVPVISKDQYRIYGELVQPLTHIRTTQHQKELIRETNKVEQQKLETELYRLRERIDELFFAVLLIDAQLRQNELLQKDIQAGFDKTNAAIANKAALKSSADMLQAELLKVKQNRIELSSGRAAFLSMLALLTNQTIDSNTILERPESVTKVSEITRPELRLYDLQQQTIQAQNELLTDKNIPQLSLFFQGGYGRPALNFLNNDFKTYYITGLRLNWNFSGLYTLHKERDLLHLNQESVKLQKDVFLLNTHINLSRQDAEMEKYKELIRTDHEIISLRENVKKTAATQLEYGTITALDFLNYVNAEDQARQSMALHEIKLLSAQYSYQTITGN